MPARLVSVSLVDIPRKQEHAGATGQRVAGQFDGGNLGVI